MKKVLVPAIALLWIATSCLAQQVIYVKADAQGIGNGLNWANAMPDLQTALAQATYGTEIRIASGMYRPTNGTSRDSTFSLKNGYRLRGGFAGTGPTPDIQNPDVYATILSGDIGMPGDSSDNSYSVMTSSGNMDETTLLEGLILEAGAATSTDPNDLWLSPRKAGGGFYCRTGSIVLCCEGLDETSFLANFKNHFRRMTLWIRACSWMSCDLNSKRFRGSDFKSPMPVHVKV
jgi:hypothetical protein